MGSDLPYPTSSSFLRLRSIVGAIVQSLFRTSHFRPMVVIHRAPGN